MLAIHLDVTELYLFTVIEFATNYIIIITEKSNSDLASKRCELISADALARALSNYHSFLALIKSPEVQCTQGFF